MMSEKILRECPFCGKMPRAFGVVEKVQCINEDCSSAYSRPLTLEAWNMRPIEGAFQMRISELEVENAKLRTDLSEIEDVAIDQQEGWQSVAVPYLPKDMWAYRKIENLAKIALGNDGSK